jgi:transposase InsO family protein
MTADEKIAHQRLSVLQLAEMLGNVTEACKMRDISRTQFYEYKRRFQTHGLEGLKDLPPIHKSHPFTTPPETVEKILEVSIEHPTWGCDRISDHLSLAGVHVSSPTVQDILIKNGMGSRYERLLKLEERALEQKIELTPLQVAQIEKANPVFKERHVESSRPGELLSQDTFYVGTLKGVGRVYLHTVVDTFSSYAFGFLHTSKQPEAAVAVLHNDVLPFYQDRDISLEKILTDNGREFCGTDSHPYELYLQLNEIKHKRTKVAHPQTNGFVERFHRTVLDEFFRLAFRTKFYETVEALQTDLDAWLVEYNTQRPHQGYRNRGRRPYDVIQEYLSQRPERSPLSPAAASDQPGAQTVSKALEGSEAPLDTGEHRATLPEAVGEGPDRRDPLGGSNDRRED